MEENEVTKTPDRGKKLKQQLDFERGYSIQNEEEEKILTPAAIKKEKLIDWLIILFVFIGIVSLAIFLLF